MIIIRCVRLIDGEGVGDYLTRPPFPGLERAGGGLLALFSAAATRGPSKSLAAKGHGGVERPLSCASGLTEDGQSITLHRSQRSR